MAVTAAAAYEVTHRRTRGAADGPAGAAAMTSTKVSDVFDIARSYPGSLEALE
jgi:hypothetical protein